MRFFVPILGCLILFSCGQSQNKGQASPSYFDLKGYFEQEINRLSTTETSVSKTVSRNDHPETRQIQPAWETELSLFAEADINKPAWKNSYRTHSEAGYIEYTALEDNLKTRRIKISREGSRIKSIHITNSVSNFLYSSVEHLAYYPDSMYVIKKEQKVKILGTNHYLVTGRFK